MLISGWSQAVSAEELEELGVAVLVSKPWDDSELKQAIRKLLA
jgi:UDP:flavonoid glycosyltransferase YjiC (YdhE family)